MPFTEYEFEGENGKLLNPDTLHNACPSDTTSNHLIGTFSNIEFETLIRDPGLQTCSQFAKKLRIDIFSKAFSDDQRKIIIKHIYWKTAFEMLISNEKFNSIYIGQECIFGKFNIGKNYHAFGPGIILEYQMSIGRKKLIKKPNNYQ